MCEMEGAPPPSARQPSRSPSPPPPSSSSSQQPEEDVASVVVCKKSEVIHILERLPSKGVSRAQSQPVPTRRATAPALVEDVAPKETGEKLLLTVRGLDGRSVEVEMDAGLSGLEAGIRTGKQLGVTLVREFGLAIPDKGGWLDEEMSLAAQGVVDKSELVYKKKFFIADEELTPRDAVDIALMYPQCVNGLLQSSFKCSQTHAIGLAALQAVVVLQESQGRLAPSVSELADFLPLEMRNGAAVKCVMDQLENMKELDAAEAKFQFVHICSLLPGYGVSAYVVGDASARRSGAISSMEKTPVLMGVSREGISRLNHKTRECLELYPFYMLQSWAVGRQTFVCDFGAHRAAGHWGVSTRSGRVIAQLISGYQRLMKERQHKSQ